MPIYAYKCESCGHSQDILRKISDAPLTDCPACGAATFVKQVTAAGFQLKGSGWYVTDFRNNGASAPTASVAPADGAAVGAKADSPAVAGGSADAPAKATDTKTAASPAPAPATSAGSGTASS